jgi:hypothetical protein
MRVIRALASLTDAEVATLEGTWLDDDSFDVLVTDADGPTTVRKADGSPLLIYLPDHLSTPLCQAALEILIDVPVGTRNRGAAAGQIAPGRLRSRSLRRDGRESNHTYAQMAPSTVLGFMEPNPRNPYCRLTEYPLRHFERFRRFWPFCRAVGHAFREQLPARYEAQMVAVQSIHRDFVIPGCPFTTVTLNRNWQTAVHVDDGDLRAGFGVMTVLRAGEYRGGFLVWPKYRVAVDMRNGGILLADVHEHHANTPITGGEAEYVRLSLVFYVREGMVTACRRSRVDENLRARQRHTEVAP